MRASPTAVTVPYEVMKSMIFRYPDPTAQEFLVREGFAVFVDHGDVVGVGVGVDTRDDFCWLACQDGNAPQSRRMLIDQARARWADKTVMGLVVSGSYEVMSAWLDTPFNGP